MHNFFITLEKCTLPRPWNNHLPKSRVSDPLRFTFVRKAEWIRHPWLGKVWIKWLIMFIPNTKLNCLCLLISTEIWKWRYNVVQSSVFVPPNLRFVFYDFIFLLWDLFWCLVSFQLRDAFLQELTQEQGKFWRLHVLWNNKKYCYKLWGKVSFIKLKILGATCLLQIQTGKS